MSPQYMRAWMAKSRPAYAANLVQSGNFSEAEARVKADDSYKILFAENDELAPGHFLFEAWINGVESPIGLLWINITDRSPPTAFIYDIEVDAAFRGRGYGRQILALAEDFARSKRARYLGLHVFAHNKVALSLYEDVGYVITNINMRKDL